MFAPARLCTSRVPRRSRIDATIAAVVVLPFVAEITALPLGQARGQGADRVRLEAQQDLAGQARAAAAGAAGERAGGARGRRGHLQPHAGTSTRSACGTARIVAGVVPIGSPSA